MVTAEQLNNKKEGMDFMQMMSTNLTVLGSRYSLIFDSSARRLRHGVLGMFLEKTSELICGVEAPGIASSYLPFSDRENRFEAVYMSTTCNSVTYQAINKEGGYNLEVTFTSPFLPGEVQMNVAPLFYVDVRITRSTRPHNLVKVKHNIDHGIFRLGLQSEGLTAYPNNNACDYTYDIQTRSQFVLGDFARELHVELYRDGQDVDRFSCRERLYSFDGRAASDGTLEVPFTLDNSGIFSTSFLLATYSPIRDFISIHGTPHNLLYTSFFSDLNEVVAYGIANRSKALAHSAVMDSTVCDSSLSQSWKDFIAFSFQSYKLNTIYSCDAAGNWAYHIWEGNCMYNSTMDVEYNNGLFYYTYFPEVLPLLFQQWADTEQGEGYIDHDCGAGYHIEKASYSYPMIVEENCNYLLMLHAYCRMRGQFHLAQEHLPVLLQLVQKLLDADTTGNGIPNVGTDNTIDDAVPAIQNAKEQTYLALKSACALQAFAELAEALHLKEEARTARDRASQICRSVDELLWRGDHYAVCTDRTQDGYWRFLTHETLSGPMEGRDSYSIYAENGLVYPMLTGFTPDFLNYPRLRQNIAISEQKCSTQYGCNHSNDSDSIWFSQNLWRDFAAAYLGHDMLDNIDKYWEFQKMMNTNGNLRLYIDTFGENALWYYPRGLTSVGVFHALLRLQIDGVAKEVRIAPLRRSLRLPLVFFADWKSGRIPWVHVTDGAVRLEHPELLGDYRLVICGGGV